MGKLDMNQAFPFSRKKPKREPVRTYDVRITENKGGREKSGNGKIRFGFLNNAAKAFGMKLYIEASNIEYTKDHIYFRTHDKKTNANLYKITPSSDAPTNSCYFAFTPSDKIARIYHMNWVGKTFQLSWDIENELYYISLKEED